MRHGSYWPQPAGSGEYSGRDGALCRICPEPRRGVREGGHGEVERERTRRGQLAALQDHRSRALAVEHGWLTLTSLQSLPADRHRWTRSRACRAPTAGIRRRTRHPDGRRRRRLVLHGNRGVRRSGRLPPRWATRIAALGAPAASPSKLAAHGDRYAHPDPDDDSPVQTDFEAVPVFDYDPDLVVAGRFDDTTGRGPCPSPRPTRTSPIITASGHGRLRTGRHRHTLVAEPEELVVVTGSMTTPTGQPRQAGVPSPPAAPAPTVPC